jgi:chromosome segregation ATPase
MSNIFVSKGKLESRIEELKREGSYLENRITSLQDDKGNLQIELNRIGTVHNIEVEKLNNHILGMEKTMKDEVAKNTASDKKDLKAKSESQEREHSNKMKSLEKEYLEKLQRIDRKLEEDKTSYRKYLKSEFNSKVETLEKDNKNLLKENGELKGKVDGLNKAIDLFQGSINPVVSLAEKIVAALPVVSAEITTPKTIDVNVNQDVGGRK